MYPGSAGSSFSWTEFRGNSYVRPERSPLPALSHVWFNGTTLYMWYQSAGSTIPSPYTFSDARFTGGRGLDGCCNAWSGSRISVESGWGVFDAMTYNLAISITDSNLVAPTSGCSPSL